MPAIPQILPIILKKIIITIGLIFNVFPMSFGSKMFPIIPDGVEIVTHDTQGKENINPQKIFDKVNDIIN